MIYEVDSIYKTLVDMILEGNFSTLADLILLPDQFPFEERNIALAKIIKNLECEHAGVKEACKAMQERASSLVSKIDHLNAFMLKDITSSGLLDPIKCSDIVIKIQNNPPAIEITDAESIPDIYKVTKEVVTFDKKLIKEDIEAGFEVEGARIVRNKRLVIK